MESPLALHPLKRNLPTAKPALHSLKPLLERAHKTGCPKNLSPEFIPQLQRALLEAEEEITPADSKAIAVLLYQVLRHFPKPAEGFAEMLTDYRLILGDYPEDILSAACVELLRSFRYHLMPKIGDFTAIMEPMMEQRRTTIRLIKYMIKLTEKNK